MATREVIEELEMKNLKLENEKLSQEISKLQQEQKKLENEEKKFEIEAELLEIKKSYLLCKLSSEFPEFILDPLCKWPTTFENWSDMVTILSNFILYKLFTYNYWWCFPVTQLTHIWLSVVEL